MDTELKHEQNASHAYAYEAPINWMKWLSKEKKGKWK